MECKDDKMASKWNVYLLNVNLIKLLAKEMPRQWNAKLMECQVTGMPS